MKDKILLILLIGNIILYISMFSNEKFKKNNETKTYEKITKINMIFSLILVISLFFLLKIS